MDINATQQNSANNGAENAFESGGAPGAAVHEDSASTVVEGFEFGNVKRAMVARRELANIKLLESRIDYSKADSIYKLFETFIEKSTFVTPFGYRYMHHLRNFLLGSGYGADKLPAIPVKDAGYTSGAEIVASVATERNVSKEEISAKQLLYSRTKTLRLSFVLNAILIFVVVLMYIVTLRSPTANMLNYETAIVNKYAIWENRLQEREDRLYEMEALRNAAPE